MPRSTAIVLLAVAFSLAGCSSGVKDIPAGISALPATSESNAASRPLENYQVGLLDEVSLVVYGEPELSSNRLVVDLSGNLTLPLIGQVRAFGRTTEDIGREVESRLNDRYLRDARVAVALIKATSYVFTVEGEVKKPGTYQIPGSVSLLQAVAIGEGVTQTAKLSEVIVFRNVDGVRYAARFNLRDIRAARADDPMLRAGDTVVVGFNAAQQIYRDVLTILPGLAGVFVAVSQNN